jgi:hypothetical protein
MLSRSPSEDHGWVVKYHASILSATISLIIYLKQGPVLNTIVSLWS